ncbi:hypothetical protein [Salinicola lusitanus]|uniref:hypothetical protein n=1 Tax=Salinicola lusitanus TaxID=1949085 RepID=UPI0013006266|nr:hypothetical protein [Salinicola lusitanus]
MNRQSPTRFGVNDDATAPCYFVSIKLPLLTECKLLAFREISGSGCFPAAASTRYGKRSSPTFSHSRVPFDHCRILHPVPLRFRGVASVTAADAVGMCSLTWRVTTNGNQTAKKYSDHEHRYTPNDVLTRSVDAISTRNGVWSDKVLHRLRVFYTDCIFYLQFAGFNRHTVVNIFRLWSNFYARIVKNYNSTKISFAWASFSGDNLCTKSNSVLLTDTGFTEFMVAFHKKRSFPARKSVTTPGDAYRAVFLSPIPAATAFPLVRGAFACSSFPARQASPASRALFIPQAITRSLLNAHRSTPAAPTHTRNTQ